MYKRQLSGSRARLLLAVEGDGEASGDSALLRPATGALVIDAHVEGPLCRARPLPPLVVALSHATDGRTVRLSPRRDWSDGAARFRVEGASLAQVVAHPGVWRVLLRAGDAILAQGLVEVAAARRTDSLAA